MPYALNYPRFADRGMKAKLTPSEREALADLARAAARLLKLRKRREARQKDRQGKGANNAR